MGLGKHIVEHSILGVPSNFQFRASDTPRARLAIVGGSKCARNQPNVATAIQMLPVGMVHWGNALMGKPFDIVSFDGYGGRQIDTCEANFADEALAYMPDVVFFGGDAIGNYTSNTAGTNATVAADAVASLTNMVNICLAAGITPIISTCPPNVQLEAANDASGDKGIKFHIANRLIRDLARSDSRIILAPWDEYSIDMTEATGRPITTTGTGAASTAWSHDGTHSQPRDSIKMGQILAEAFGGRFGYSTLQWPSSNTDPYKAVLNPLNYGDAGSGVSPNCVLTGAGAVGTKVTRTDYHYNAQWQRIVTTTSAASTTFAFTTTSAIPANMTVGSSPIYAAVEFMLNALPTNLRGVKITLSFAGSPTTFVGFSTSSSGGFASYADAGPYFPLNQKLILYTPTYTLPANATAMTITVEMTKSSLGNLSSDVYIGRGEVFLDQSNPFIVTPPTVP